MSETVSAPSSGLIERARNILLKPSATWDAIAAEPSSIKSIYLGYVVPLAAIPPIARAIGSSVFGFGIPGLIHYRTPVMLSVSAAIVEFVLTLVMVFIMALVIDALAPSFGGQKDRLRAFKVSAYSATAAWLAGIFSIFPALGVLAILGLYSLYLLYLGLPKLMGSPKEKAIGYTAVTIIIMIVLWFIIGAISSPIYRLGAPGGLMTGAATGAAVGTAVVPGVGSVDLNRMEQAAKQMEANASALQAGQAVKTADPDALLALMPQAYMGAERGNTRASADSAGGMAVSNAEATYATGTGTIRLKIGDMGSMSGFGAMAQAINVSRTETTDTGYEKVVSNNGRMITEKYDNASRSGSYTVLVGSRITIEAEGDNVDMAALKGLVDSIDAGKAEALTR